MKAPEYLKFRELPNGIRKTKLIQVRTARSGAVLGEIRWYSPWRRYVWAPAEGTIFDYGCMNILSGKIMRLQEEHSKALKERQ